jgi:hypothetical protein
MSRKYFFANFLVNENNGTKAINNTLDCIRNFLNSGTEFISPSHRYAFLKINNHSCQDKEYFLGYLSKILPESTVEIADSGEIISDTQENLIIAKSHFLIDISSKIIVYHPTKGIDSELFLSAFQRIFEEYNEPINRSILITKIDKTYEILRAISEFEVIKKVTVKLRPSNPHSQPIWDATDQRIRNIGVTEYFESYSTNISDHSLKVLGDEELASKIQMAEDGYGEARVSGIKDGVLSLVKTGKNLISGGFKFDENEPVAFMEKIHQFITDMTE